MKYSVILFMYNALYPFYNTKNEPKNRLFKKSFLILNITSDVQQDALPSFIGISGLECKFNIAYHIWNLSKHFKDDPCGSKSKKKKKKTQVEFCFALQIKNQNLQL